MEYVQIGNRRLELPNEIVAAGPAAVEAFVANPPAWASYVAPLPKAGPTAPAADAEAAPAEELTPAAKWLAGLADARTRASSSPASAEPAAVNSSTDDED